MGHPLPGVIQGLQSQMIWRVHSPRMPKPRTCYTPDVRKFSVTFLPGLVQSGFLAVRGRDALATAGETPALRAHPKSHPVSPKNGETRMGHPSVIFFSAYGNSGGVCSQFF
jgi:hypothetical protein